MGGLTRRGYRWTIVAFSIAAACGHTAPPDAAPANQAIANLHAFAHLYGVVRWFHPSDEAAAIDWDRYAVIGVRAVRSARNADELAKALAAWVAPIGPTIQILAPGQRPAVRVVDAKAPQVAWQYLGPGFDGGQSDTYQSRRTHRIGTAVTGAGWGSFAQKIDATPLRGHEVRLRAQVRAGKRTSVAAWLRVDREGGGRGFFDNMGDRSVKAATWTAVTLHGPVAVDAVNVVFGGLATGTDGWFDAFALDVDDGHGGWTPVTVANPDLDAGTTGWETGGRQQLEGFTLEVAPGSRSGGPSAHLFAPTIELTKDLFDAHPAADEASDIDLGGGLHAVVPLSLATANDHTVPAGNLAAVTARTDALSEMSSDDEAVRIADIIVAWNVLQHFYPYHDVISRPWVTVIDDAIAEAIAATTPVLHADALRHLIAAVEDGHGNVDAAGVQPEFLPLRLGLVEGKPAVLVSAVPEIQRGDVITAIDGVPVNDALAAERARHSGSPQWRDVMTLLSVGSGPHGTSATLTVEREGGPRPVVVARSSDIPPLYTYPPISEARPGVWLIDLSRAKLADIEAQIATLAAARGVVFDMRRYPNDTGDVLAHLVPVAEHDRWMHVAQIIRPNQPGTPAPTWSSVGWDIEPKAPRLTNKVVFITGPGAISYAESVMGYVESLHLPIVGSATAGTNGDVRPTPLPSGARFTFTGLKVTRHDGTRSHLLGIRPTIPVEPTLAGIRAGKDEVLERALSTISP